MICFCTSWSAESNMSLSHLNILAVLLVLTHATPSVQQGCEGSPTVTIAQGTLRGRRNVTAQGTEYYMFLGIPYAAPPVGRLRFVSPQPPSSWYEERDASRFGSPCNQVDLANVIVGEEDCLFINVFTPKLPCRRRALLPVMVWIHGGGFSFGHGNIYPGHLLDHAVVIVSFNYRLNVFGFLSVKGTDVAGNAGLKDQVAALGWVRRNIAHFGGDPRRVTIFGVSAGGASVHHHLLSPLSRGLFHRAISESGSALSKWAFRCSTEQRAYRLSYVVGRGANNSQDLVKNLRATPALELTAALPNILPASTDRVTLYPFMPTLEYPREDERPFLLQSPECIETTGSFQKIPYLTGVTLKEIAILVPETVMSQPSYWRNISNNLEVIVPHNLGLRKGSWLSQEVSRKIKEFYFGYKTISYENRDRWIDLLSDLYFVKNVQTTLLSHARLSHATETYNYQFIYNNATHADDLKYVFYAGKVDRASDEAMVAGHFGNLWTHFAKYGVPISGNGFHWPPVTKNIFPFLQISTFLKLGYNLENDRMNFWAGIYRHYGKEEFYCCRN